MGILTTVLESSIFNGSYTLHGLTRSGKRNYYHNTMQLKSPKSPTDSGDCEVNLQFQQGRKIAKIQVICNILCFSAAIFLVNSSGLYSGLIRSVSCQSRNVSSRDATVVKRRSRRSSSTASSIDVKYVELYVVYDHDLYVASGRNIHNCVAKVSEIVNALDTIYRPVNVRVVLAGLEVWTESNKIEITSSAQATLNRFAVYIEKIENVDNIQLLTKQIFDDKVLGLAYVGSMCSKLYSTGVSTFDGHSYYNKFISTLAHEIGHNLNMSHDVINSCICGDPTGRCIMYYQSIPNSNPKTFSECSIASLDNFLKSSLSSCLSNRPSQFGVAPSSGSKCGNNNVESGEECDCGSADFSSDSCCDCTNCKFKSSHMECSHGVCCSQCRLSSNKTVCRPSVGECDVTDYCDGLNDECKDTFVENGVNCSLGGVCIDGKCVSREHQCKLLWGSTASDARDSCYEQLNIYGRSYGHCGVINETENTYSSCDEADVFCGKLQCTNVSYQFPVIGFSSGYSKIRLKYNGEEFTCRSGNADLGRNHNNPGMVADWTPCGDGKYCLRNKCVTHGFSSICLLSCKPNGVCTNHGVCHCNTNWTGPTCNTWQPRIDNTIESTVFLSSSSACHFPSTTLVFLVILMLR